MLDQRRQLILGGSLVLVSLLVTAGCHSAGDNIPPPPSAATLAAEKANSIQQVQNNPNLPPEQKAAIIARIQGQGTPGVAPSAPPPR